MDEAVNPLDRDHFLSVVLPGGLEKNATVHGSKPVMDLLVTLCASYHLNPSDYTVEVLSPNKNNIRFKPNSPIGLLEAEKIVLKPKGMEEKIRRPYMPEPSVRLLINYNKSHKAVVRVNPKVPLEMLLPAMCEKCEFQVETTVLLRDSQSKELLDLSKSLNEHGLREVFAKDTAVEHQHRPKTPEKAVTPTEVVSPPPPLVLPKKKKQKENTGFLSLFRRRTKKTEGAVSASGSSGLKVGVSTNVQSVSSSSNTLTADMTKKRRAPQPPMGVSQSLPNNLSTCHIRGGQRSADSTLRSTKRRAPPPPCANNHQAHTEVKGAVDSLRTLEELRESDESNSLSFSSSSSPSRSPSSSSFSRPSLSHLREVADPYLPSFRGKDLLDARCALARVLTSSVSRGALVSRLRNSTAFPKFNHISSSISVSHKFSDNGVCCAELEPVVTSDLPTEPEWEDPMQRRVMTSFKVVPAQKQKSTDAEITLNVPERSTIEDYPNGDASAELLKDQTESEEDPCCPGGSGTETSSSSSPEPSSQDASNPPYCLQIPLDLDKNLDCQSSTLSEVGDAVETEEEDEPEATSEVELPSEGQIHPEDQSELLQRECVTTSAGHCGTNAEETEVEEEGEDCFPPPPPPVFYNEDNEGVEERKEDATASSLPSNQTSNGQINASNEDHQSEAASASPDPPAAAPQSVNRSPAPSRFAQAVALAVQRSRSLSHGKGQSSQAPSGSIYQYGA